MRLPTSTVVLAVATLIPFGLALRDTLAGTPPPPEPTFDEPELDQADDAPEIASLIASAQREAAERAAQQLEERRAVLARRALIPQLYGREVASLGAKFASVHLGDRLGTASTVESTDEAELRLIDDGVRTLALTIRLYEREHGDCQELEQAVRAAWGAPSVVDDRRIWMGSTQRAVWELETCSLTFERIAPLAEWLARDRRSLVPLWAIGRPVRELLRVAELEGSADDRITWSVPGIGIGYDTTRLRADLAGDVVVSITATLRTDAITQTELSARISRLVGAEPEIPAGRPDVERWKATRTTPRIQLVDGAPNMFLTLGASPP